MRFGKRAFDIAIGSVLAVVASPFILIAAGLSAVSLRAWPFFVQHRVGRAGLPFRIVKVRTLPPAAPCYAAKTTLSTEALPRSMRFLRRTHLDELPQLFLVPLGSMSLVGPRPEMSFLHERFTGSTAELRTSVRPGCTGLWQIGEGSSALINEAPEYDHCYLSQQSLRLDAWILWRTFRLMFTGAAPVNIDRLPQWTLRTDRSHSEIELTRERVAAVRESV